MVEDIDRRGDLAQATWSTLAPFVPYINNSISPALLASEIGQDKDGPYRKLTFRTSNDSTFAISLWLVTRNGRSYVSTFKVSPR